MYICVDWCQVIYIYAFFQLTSFDVDYGGGIHISVHSINEQPKKKNVIRFGIEEGWMMLL